MSAANIPKALQIAIYLGSKQYESEKDDKDQETIQSSTTPDPGHHMGK